MKPEVAAILEHHSQILSERIVPLLTGFDANSAAMMSAMLKMVAEEWDGAAAWRVEENAAIRVIFNEAAPIVSDKSLASRLQTLAAGADTDLRLSALESSNDALRAALIDLHAYVEAVDGPQARAVNESIWAELRRSVERRKVSSANF